MVLCVCVFVWVSEYVCKYIHEKNNLTGSLKKISILDRLGNILNDPAKMQTFLPLTYN